MVTTGSVAGLSKMWNRVRLKKKPNCEKQDPAWAASGAGSWGIFDVAEEERGQCPSWFATASCTNWNLIQSHLLESPPPGAIVSLSNDHCRPASAEIPALLSDCWNVTWYISILVQV